MVRKADHPAIISVAKWLKQRRIMPTYLYRCSAASYGDVIERIFPMGQAPETVQCPICTNQAHRVFTAPSIHYFGNGWTTKTTHDHPEGSVKKAMKMWEQQSQ